MSNNNNNMQTQTSSALHNAIMEAGGTSRQQHPRGEVMKTFATVLEDIQKWINVEAESIQIILIRSDNDIYFTVDACPNAMEMWKSIERLKQGEAINSQDLKNVSYHKLYDILKQHQNEVNEIRAERLARTANQLSLIRNPKLVAEDDASSNEKDIEKLMALISMCFKKIYKPTNNNLDTSSNTRNLNVDNIPRSSRGSGYDRQTGQYDNQRVVNVVGARENVVNLELEAHYMYMEKIQEVTLDAATNSRPIFDVEPLQKEEQEKSFKTHEENEIEKVIRLEKQVKVLNDIVYKKGVIPTTSVSRPQLKSNQLEDSVMHNNSQGKKQQVEDHHRNFKFSNNKKSVTASNDSLNAKTSNVNFVCVTYGKCVLNDNHDLSVLHYINVMSSRTRQPIIVPISTREPKHNVNQSVATSRNVNPNVSMPLGNASRTANILEHKTPRCSTVSNTPLSSNSFAARTVKFGNDQIAPILGYGDLVQGTITIKRVYYVEGLNHNLFSIGQFCDADLEVAFQKSTCYIRDLKGNDLLT
ncbi:hypothetical protein Tco_0777061, partial [Tanacetum coccineum]